MFDEFSDVNRDAALAGHFAYFDALWPAGHAHNTMVWAGCGSRYGAADRFVRLGLVAEVPVLLAVILLPGSASCASFTTIVVLCSAVGVLSLMLVIA